MTLSALAQVDPRAEELSRQVRDLHLRLLAANGELRREVARADRAEAANGGITRIDAAVEATLR